MHSYNVARSGEFVWVTGMAVPGCQIIVAMIYRCRLSVPR